MLYDAFFKHQRKPKMTGLGELYYEGKEYEAQLEHLKAGVLSEELREALGMGDNTPPPWLVNMQVCVRGGRGGGAGAYCRLWVVPTRLWVDCVLSALLR